MVSLTHEMVVEIQSMKRGKTAERGLSPRIMAVVMPVTLVTLTHITEIIVNACTIILYISYTIPADGMDRDVITRLEKVGVVSGTGEATTLAAMSVM